MKDFLKILPGIVYDIAKGVWTSVYKRPKKKSPIQAFFAEKAAADKAKKRS